MAVRGGRSTRLSGVKRARTGPQSTNTFNERHAGDRTADREPVYNVSIPAPESTLVISNDKRDTGTAMSFTQNISTVPNVGRVRINKLVVDHLFDTINTNNNVIIYDRTATGATAFTFIIPTGLITSAALATLIAAQIQADIITISVGFTCTIVATVIPGGGRTQWIFTTTDGTGPDPLFFFQSSFFTYGNSVHGMSNRTLPAHYDSAVPLTVPYVSPTGWFPPAVLPAVSTAVPINTGMANNVPSHYYVISSINLTQGTKLQSYGTTQNAIGIIYNITDLQATITVPSNWSQEGIQTQNTHQISATQTRQIGGAVDIRIEDEFGFLAQSSVENFYFSVTLVIGKHY